MKTLIIDDEPEARRLLREFCGELDALQVVGESNDGVQALDDIRRLRPQLVFLDVQMPEMDGFGVLARLASTETPPHVVFTTAFDQYAVRAFEVAAKDYLLKPFDKERFRAAVARVLETPRDRPASQAVLFVRASSGVRAVEAHDVRWIEASGDYAKVHATEGTFLATSSLGKLEEELDPDRFLRVHRSAMVYLPAIQRLYPKGQGGWIAELKDGTAVPVGRTYVATLKERCV